MYAGLYPFARRGLKEWDCVVYWKKSPEEGVFYP
jgi:hypothetical protein